VTFLGVFTRADGCIGCCDSACAPTPTPFFEDGRRVYQVNGGQLLIVVEGAKGLSNLQVGQSTLPEAPDSRPDIQIETTRRLGDGVHSSCANGTGGGGVPGIDPPDYTPESPPGPITSALNSFACQFEYHAGGSQCTWSGDPTNLRFVDPRSTAQFCDVMSANAPFNSGDSIVTVQLRDTLPGGTPGGNTGPTVQIVVRVNTPTPKP
jgi:hypothetical protein